MYAMSLDQVVAPADDLEPSGLERFAGLMPWAVSIVFHIGLLLVFVFLALPGLRDDPGSGMTDKAKPQMGLIDPRSPPGIRLAGAQDLPGGGGGGGGMGGTDEFAASADWDRIRGVLEGSAPPVIGLSKPGSADGLLELIGEAGTGKGSGVLGPGKDPWDLAGPGPRIITPRVGALCHVFVIDSSGSMFRHFDYVKAEMARLLEAMPKDCEFTIIFFADGKPDVMPVGPAGRLQSAAPEVKTKAIEWVRKKVPQSRGEITDPREALQTAFALRPAPEIIYLLSDGVVHRGTAALVGRLNPERTVRIDTIGFVDRVGEELLRTIAADNGGEYRFVSEMSLMDRPRQAR